MVLATNSDYFNIRHELVGFHNREEECLVPARNKSLNKIQANLSFENEQEFQENTAS
jgi:hypothetical protein